LNQLEAQVKDAGNAVIIDDSEKLLDNWKHRHCVGGGCRNLFSQEIKDLLSTLISEEILEALRRNEDGDAALFIKKFRDRYLYDHSSGRWHHFEKHHWEEDLIDNVMASVQDVAKLYEDEYKRQADLAIDATRKMEKDQAQKCNALMKEILSRIKLLRAMNRKKDVVSLAKTGTGTLGIAGTEWNTNPMRLGCKNGVIDLGTGILRPGKPSDYIKVVAPIEYEPDARCPVWEEYLNSTFGGDRELIAYIQKRCGYAITGQTTEHDFIFLEGPGRNGKTTFIEATQYPLGDLAGQIEVEALLTQIKPRQAGSPSPELMALREKRSICAVESDQGKSLNAGRVKWLTGGDTLVGREMYGKRQISFTPTFKLWFVTNHLPHIDSEDFAIWSRIRRIEFKFAFVSEPKEENERKADPFILEKLKKEASGIFTWMVAGCLMWQAQGLTPPDIVKAATENYRCDEDIINRFLHDVCTFGKNERTKAGELYQAYQRWCQKNGHRAMSGTRFGKNMKKNYDHYEERHFTFYVGIDLLKPTLEEEL